MPASRPDRGERSAAGEAPAAAPQPSVEADTDTSPEGIRRSSDNRRGVSARPGPALSLKGRALRHLSSREHTRAELRRKLLPHTDDPEALERLLDELATSGWQSEARCVESVVHRKAARLGAARIRQELTQRGIAAHEVRDAVAGLQDSEAERARALWQGRFGPDAPSDLKERARQTRFLLTRGFAPGVVRQVLRDAGLGDTNDSAADLTSATFGDPADPGD